MTSACRNHRCFAPSRFLRDANVRGRAKDGPQPQYDGIHHPH